MVFEFRSQIPEGLLQERHGNLRMMKRQAERHRDHLYDPYAPLEISGQLCRRLQRYGCGSRIGENHVYFEAVEACLLGGVASEHLKLTNWYFVIHRASFFQVRYCASCHKRGI